MAATSSIEWTEARRIVDPRGYALRRVPGHHLADCRGYAYEHRLVAEDMLGRPLRDGEEVHHRNEIKSDNRPENLEVCGSRHAHREHHRRKRTGRRRAGVGNPRIDCACGCGEQLLRFDADGRPRRFITGHNLSVQRDPATGRMPSRSLVAHGEGR